MDLTSDNVVLSLMCALETIFPPLAGPVLPLAGVAVSRGEASLWATIAFGAVGSTAGSLVLYATSRCVGQHRVRSWLLGHSLWSGLAERHFDRAEEWFERRGEVVVVLGRCVPVMRSLVSIPAGLVPMPIVRFTVLTLAGNLLWSAGVVGVSAELGDRFTVIRVPSLWIQVLVMAMWVLVLFGGALLWLLRQRGDPASRGTRPVGGGIGEIEDPSE